MAGTKRKQLRWRENCIRYWRERKGLTLEIAADVLSQAPYKFSYTHNSLGRVENGKQMPSIGLIEALAKLYGTDIDSLLNRRPEDSEAEPMTTARSMLRLWDQAEPEERNLIIDVAKRVIKTGT